MRTLRRIGGLFNRPGATFEEIKAERLRRGLMYLLVLLLPVACLLVLLSFIVIPLFIAPQLGDRQYLGWVGIGVMALLVPVGGLAAVTLAGVLLHPLVRLLGGRQGLGKTMQAVIYGSTPLVLSLWFPPAMVATPVWSAVLAAIGLRRLQELATTRAVAAVVLPVIVLMAAGVAAGLVFW